MFAIGDNLDLQLTTYNLRPELSLVISG